MHAIATRAKSRLPHIAPLLLSAILGILPVPAAAGTLRDGGLGLCVGIDRYAHFTPLSSAGAGSEAVAAALEGTKGFRHVFRLADAETVAAAGAADPFSMRPATRAGILDTLRLVSNNATRDDALVFFFSGHGLSAEGKFYIMPLDAEPKALVDPDAGIPVDEIVAIMRKSRAASKLLLLDANSDLEMFPGIDGTVDAGADDFTVIVSCSEGQRSVVDAERGMGLFAMGLEAALSRGADADGDDALTGVEFREFLETYMRDYNLEALVSQMPQTRTGDPELTLAYCPAFGEPEEAPPPAALAETPEGGDAKTETPGGASGKPTDVADAPEIDEEELLRRYAAAESLKNEGKYELAFAAFMDLTGYNMPEAEFQVGDAYAYGRGTEENYRKAEEWYIRAGDLGHAKAQENLYWMYYGGIGGIPMDSVKAAKWGELKGKIPDDAKPVIDKRPGGGVVIARISEDAEKKEVEETAELPAARPVYETETYLQSPQPYQPSRPYQYRQQRSDPGSPGMRVRRFLLGY